MPYSPKGVRAWSSVVGTTALVAITAIAGNAKLGAAGNLAWYYFIGGLLGAAYVTIALVTFGGIGILWHLVAVVVDLF